jgi:hypothetical protein
MLVWLKDTKGGERIQRAMVGCRGSMWNVFVVHSKFRKTVGIPPGVKNRVEKRNLC